MSQCSRATCTPKAAIARAPTEPTIASSLGAIASKARPMRSSLSAWEAMPKTSGTAHAAAQSCTRGNGVRGGQLVGHQHLDHLPMGQGGHLPDRAGAVHDPFKVKPPAEAGHHRQCSQQLLHPRRAVAGALPARSLSWSLSRHREMLADPKPHQHNNPSMLRSIPGPRLRMCGGRD
jgi:hypothetical protein